MAKITYDDAVQAVLKARRNNAALRSMLRASIRRIEKSAASLEGKSPTRHTVATDLQRLVSDIRAIM